MVFVWWTLFHFVNHKNSFRLHRNHVIKRFSLRWVPRRGQSELPWSKYPRSNIRGHVNLISNGQNFDQDPKFRLCHRKLKMAFLFSSKSLHLDIFRWMFLNFFGIYFHEQKIVCRHLFNIQGQGDPRTTECERCHLKITISSSFFWNLNLKSFVQSYGQVLDLGLSIVLDDKAIL